MVMSILVSAGMGVVTATSTCVVLSVAPGKGVMQKLLLLELEVVACCACSFCAGLVLAGSGVPGGVVLGLLIEVKILWSGSRVRSICVGAG